MSKGYTVIVDTREKIPMKFNKSKYCAGSIVEKLDSGDYSLWGLEDLVTLERKMTVSELAQNIMQDRFHRELDRLTEYEHAIVLCEFSFNDLLKFPYNSGLPKSTMKRIRVKGEFLQRKVLEITLDYGIPVHYAGNAENAKKYANVFFKSIWKKYKPRDEE